MWRRSLDFGVIEDIRQISARIRDHFAQGGAARPGLRPQARARRHSRGRILHPDPADDPRRPRSVGARRRRRSMRLQRWPRPGGSTQPDATALADAYRLLRTIEHRVQMIEDAQTHTAPGGRRGARRRRAAARARRRRASCSICCGPHVERAGALFDGLAPETGGRLSNDPDILLDELADDGLRRPGSRRAAHRRSGARGGRGRCARRPRRTRSRRCFPGCSRAIAAGPDPEHALNRLSDIVERLSSGVNLYRLLEARPELGAAAGQDPRPCAGAVRAARPAARAARGAVRRVELRPAAVGRGIRRAASPSAMRGQPYDVALDRVRRLVNERRFALGVQLIDLRDDPLDVAAGYSRVAEGDAARAGRRRGARVRERARPDSRAASW